MRTACVVLLALLLPWLELRPWAAEPVLPLRTNDVIAFIGGANMVALAQGGDLERILTYRHPHYRLRFRSLAWEGDTVFAQPRDVNYPDIVTQLKQVGATLALVQFGQMESLAGEAGLTNFVAAYADFLRRISDQCPRTVLLRPNFENVTGEERPHAPLTQRDAQILLYSKAIRDIAKVRRPMTAMLSELIFSGPTTDLESGKTRYQLVNMEALDVTTEDHLLLADAGTLKAFGTINLGPHPELRAAIAEKNRLWFDYARPSNWAFLAGDRTEQAFSRDYRDRNIRAFAQEMQQFLPLIADAEKRIDELAAKAAADKETTR